MRAFIIFVFLFLLLLYITSCRSDQHKIIVAKTFYPNGQLKSKSLITTNGILIDTAFYYYENGMDSLIEVRNDSGILNGEVAFFNNNGKIAQKGNYVDGQKNGIALRYYLNGRVESINYYLFDQMAGDVYGLTNDGRIEYYTFYDFQQRARTYVSWNSVGRVKTSIGKIVYVDSVKVDTADNIYKIALLISNPPMSRTEVIIDYLGKNNEMLQTDTLINERFFSTSGKLDGKVNKIKFYGVQYDTSGNVVYKDSSYRILKR